MDLGPILRNHRREDSGYSLCANQARLAKACVPQVPSVSPDPVLPGGLFLWCVNCTGKAGLVALGLPTVAALTPSDWEVVIHDARVTPVDYEQKFDLMGITGYTAEIPSTYAIADEFRKRGIPVVLGGVHVSARPEEALKQADAIVIGEAEGYGNNF